MHTWIAIHLPLLPLEALRPRWARPGRHVVLARDEAVAVSALARADGVRIGMRRGGILGLCPQAELLVQNETAEQGAAESIALALLQFTPEVAYAGSSTLLLDVSASLRVFGGRLALCRLLRAAVEAVGFTLRLGMGPTAQGAWLLANHGPGRNANRRRRVVRLPALLRCLDRLPVTALPQALPFLSWLEGIGCRTLADLRRLPRAGLKRRSSADLLQSLDRAYGEAPELFDWVQAPPAFHAALELPERVEHAEGVLFGARRLLLQMTGWLVARQLAVTQFSLVLEHERGRRAVAPTRLDVALAEAAWQEAHLTRLLKERLARTTLSAPVIGLRLDAARLEDLLPPSASLFPEPGGTPSDFRKLLELLRARLGEEAVCVPALRADHRPEVANRWQPLARVPAAGVHGATPVLPGLVRPFWLLEMPQELSVRGHRPWHRSPLQLLGPPERIECGWWDEHLVVRDYFIAQDAQAVCYWIYRERCGNDLRWYLHGLFG